jgi:hypothetical protein
MGTHMRKQHENVAVARMCTATWGRAAVEVGFSDSAASSATLLKGGSDLDDAEVVDASHREARGGALTIVHSRHLT